MFAYASAPASGPLVICTQKTKLQETQTEEKAKLQHKHRAQAFGTNTRHRLNKAPRGALGQKYVKCTYKAGNKKTRPGNGVTNIGQAQPGKKGDNP